MSNREKGTVKWFNESKGYGFIKGNSSDYFVHYRDICVEGYKTLHEGQEVTFEPVKESRGLKAENVQIV